MDALTSDKFHVEHRGTKVALIIGNVELVMSYKTALTMSGALRLRAQQAKLEAGDTNMIFGLYGELEDLETIVRREQARKMY